MCGWHIASGLKPIVRPCRVCGIEVHPNPTRIKKGEYICAPCHRAASKLRRERPENRQKNAARSKLQSAVRYGKIERRPCEVCGSENSEAHHEDYGRPFDVRWLCRTHHAERHAVERLETGSVGRF